MEPVITRTAEPTDEACRALGANAYDTATLAGETFHLREYGTDGPRARFAPQRTLQIVMAPPLADRLKGAPYCTLGRVTTDGAFAVPIEDPRDRLICRIIAAAWWFQTDTKETP